MKSYTSIEANFWTGRVDDLHDVDSFRMHQIIKLLNFKELQNLKLDPQNLTFVQQDTVATRGLKETQIGQVLKNIGIINFDAHFDIRPYDTQSSSGTMFSQIADYCTKDEKEFNYLCLGIQPSGNTKSLFNKADSLGVKYVLASEFVESDPDTISAKIKAFINDNDYIYLTLCGDVFSSSFAPGVSAMQPFCLQPNHVLRFTKEILQSKKVISFDIAEVSPPLDEDKRTAILPANILYAVIDRLCE